MTTRSLPRTALALAAALALATALPAHAAGAAAASAPVSRLAQDPLATWDLSPIYRDDAAFEAARQALLARVPALKQLQGTLSASPAALLKAMDAISSARREEMRLDAYASLQSDVDTRVDAHQALRQSATSAESQVEQSISWLNAEVIAMGAARVDAAIAAEQGLKKHAYALHTMLRQASHTLSAPEEALLAAAAEPLQRSQSIYETFTNADMPWPTITVRGQRHVLDQETYGNLRGDPDPKVREQVFHAFWPVWKAYERSIGEMYVAHLKATVFNARARHYPDSLSMLLDTIGTPEQVYRTLVTEANAGLPVLQRWIALRAKLTGLKQPRYSDIYVDLAPPKTRIPLAQAEAMTLEAVKPLGPEYVDALRQHFGQRWMHAVPQPGKRGGAYMNPGAYDAHPYVLMTYNDDYLSMSTVAHEWGHAMHSVLANAAQPFETANYGLFVAEIPSTANEMLLVDDVARKAKTREERIFAISRELELLRTTFFRQAMFAEFELRAHEAIEKDQPLTGADLSRLYLGLLKHYHGDAQGVMKIEDLYGIEWAFIPHFYSDYYVYQYATSISAAAWFAEGLGRGDASVRERYLGMLKAGGSDDPYRVVRDAGVDLATPAPYRALVSRMSRLLDELETLTASPAAPAGKKH